MPIAYADVAKVVLDEVAEFQPMYDEHVSDYGEVLPHVLFGDLSRFTISAHRRGDDALTGRIARLMERLLRDGDELTTNLVAVSFVENIAPDDVDTAFFAQYGPRLRATLTAVWGVDPLSVDDQP